MQSDEQMQAQIDTCTAYLRKHCTIADVMQACGQALTEAQPWTIAGVAHADAAIRALAARHEKPAPVTAMLVLVELAGILTEWTRLGQRVP